MTFDPYGPAGGPPSAAAGASPQRPRAPLATVMTAPRDPPTRSRPLQPTRSTAGAGRWVGGPLLAAMVGALTVWIAGMVSAAQLPPPKPHGKLRLSSDPEGATVVVDGKLQTRPTPTVIEGEIGATLRVGFKLDGYLDKEADVFVGEGERPFRAKLDKRELAPPTPQEPLPQALEPPVAPTATPIREPRPRKESHRDRTPATTPLITATPSSGATTGSLSVHVRPWAIVYVDGAKIRQTPLDGHSLAAGLHVIELVNDAIKKREKLTLDVRPSGHEEIRRDWEK